MRFFFSLFLPLASMLLSCVAAQGDVAAALASMPSCAQSCILTAISHSSCAPTNATCVCTNTPLQAEVEVCVLQNCTLRKALTTKNITQTTCGVAPQDRGPQYNLISITIGSISGVFVVVRLAHKIFASSGVLGADDWFILATIVSGVPGTIINTHGLVANGLGKDVWTIPFDKITNFAFWFLVIEAMYFAHVTLLKMSLLFFYMRIFSHNKLCRDLIWATVAFNAVFGATFVFLAIFQCAPISFYWHKWDGEHVGTCVNINAIGWANAAISIALDLWMLLLPLSQVRKLNLHWKKKIGVAMMFCVGTFVTIVSMIRLQSLVAFANSQNPTWDQFEVATWSTVEINTGIICACMPSVRIILVGFFPKLLGTTRHGTSAAQYYMHSSSGEHHHNHHHRHQNLTGGGRSQRQSRSARNFGNEAIITTNTNKKKTRTVDCELESGIANGGGRNGVVFAKEHPADYHDETCLVQMRELEASSSKTMRSGTPF